MRHGARWQWAQHNTQQDKRNMRKLSRNFSDIKTLATHSILHIFVFIGHWRSLARWLLAAAAAILFSIRVSRIRTRICVITESYTFRKCNRFVIFAVVVVVLAIHSCFRTFRLFHISTVRVLFNCSLSAGPMPIHCCVLRSCGSRRRTIPKWINQNRILCAPNNSVEIFVKWDRLRLCLFMRTRYSKTKTYLRSKREKKNWKPEKRKTNEKKTLTAKAKANERMLISSENRNI